MRVRMTYSISSKTTDRKRRVRLDSGLWPYCVRGVTKALDWNHEAHRTDEEQRIETAVYKSAG